MSERKPTIGVLYGEGFNCNTETGTAIRLAGGDAQQIHVNELGQTQLAGYDGLVFPGGFTAGDAVRAGIVLARRIEAMAGDQLRRFAEVGKPVLGICNGFQILVDIGLLPQGQIGDSQTATLAHNTQGRFECRWVDLAVNPDVAASPIVPADIGPIVTLPVAHGEGRFITDPDTLERMRRNGQILLQYCDEDGQPTQEYPANPNNADAAIAAVCNADGNVVGSMSHFERFVDLRQHPNWRRPEFDILVPHGLPFMHGLVEMANQA